MRSYKLWTNLLSCFYLLQAYEKTSMTNKIKDVWPSVPCHRERCFSSRIGYPYHHKCICLLHINLTRMKALNWFIGNISKTGYWCLLEIVVSKSWTNYLKTLAFSEAIKQVVEPEPGIWSNSLVLVNVGYEQLWLLNGNKQIKLNKKVWEG